MAKARRHGWGSVLPIDNPQAGLWASSSLSAPMFADIEPAWSHALTDAAAHIRTFTAGWDGPGSNAVANHALFLAETLIREALEGCPSAAVPYLVPGGDGSIQVEWHERDGEIELSIDPEGALYVWGRSHLSGQEFEGEGKAARVLFARWAPRLATNNDNPVDISPQKETASSSSA